MVSTAAAAQEDNTAGDSTTVRIVARKLESGRIEFGLQQRQTDNTWGDRQLPRVRFFPTTATVGNWLASSSLDLPAGEVRIVARKLDDGRHRVRPPTTPTRQLVGRPTTPPRPLLPHHRHRESLARQLAAHPHNTPTRR